MIKKINLLRILLALSFLLVLPNYSFAQYTNFRIIEPREGNEPQPRAILWSKGKASALIHYNDEHITVVDGVRIDKEWRVKEIKRESIVFGRTSEKKYIEYYIDSDKRPFKNYKKWSFYGLPITLWEAVVLLTDGFGFNAVMHNFCTGASVPHITSKKFNDLLHSILPSQNAARLDGKTLFIFPINTPNEKWTNILNRKRKFNSKALAIRFPGLEKDGIITSKGDDIQYILRVISLGGNVPIKFPKDLHFSVYANFKKVPFHKILSDIVYTNQCILAEREKCIEVIPWFGNKTDNEKENQEDFLISDPIYFDRKSGSGPYPPPLLADPSFSPEVVTESLNNISNNQSHPLVRQKKGYSMKSGDSE